MPLGWRGLGDARLYSAAARYGFSMAAVLTAFALRMMVMPLTGNGAPFVLLFAAMLAISIFAGTGPAILALVISVPLAVATYHGPSHTVTRVVFQALLYCVTGLFVVYLAVLTDRRRRRMQEALDLAPDAYFLADLAARLTDVNEAASTLLGYERAELVGKSVFDIIRPEDVPRLEVAKAELMMPHKVHMAQWVLRRKDGTPVPVEVSSKILPDGRWQAFVRDTTDARRIAADREQHLEREQLARQQAEDANAKLRESEERFRLTIDEAPIGMALIALDGRYVRVNRVLCEITGYSAEELTAMNVQAVIHPDDLGGDVEIGGKLTRGEIPRYQREKRYIRKDKSIVDVMVSGSALRGSDGAVRYYIAQVEDITDRKRAAEALQQAVATRDDVLRIVAHDLRNPLSTIIAQASMLERPEPEPERRDMTPEAVIMRSAKRMNDLIQDLLDVAVVEAGQLKLVRQRLSAAELARDVVEAQKPLASSSRLELRLDVGRDVHEIWGDRNRLLRVFDNLIGNALKFTKEGGHITVAATASDHEVVFSVADTGAGIPPESLPHVFDRFWQAAGRASRLGAGLGLPITRGIVEAHNGRIWVKSTVGGGSTFYFTIPEAPAEAEPSLRPALPQRRASRQSGVSP